VKSYFHFLFIGAVLLGSLIIFNNQQGESVSRLTDNHDPLHTQLLAEICSTRIATSIIPSQKHITNPDDELVSGNLKHLEYLNSTEHQARIKTQMQIHLELLPVLGIQSGQYLHYNSRSDDPPLS